jgi:3-oxoacyl-[acyl-carrier protein] reductase
LNVEVILSEEFKGKTAIVTGGAGGIGQAVATQLLAAGCHLVIVDRDRDRLDSVKDQLGGRDILAVQADVTREEDVDRYVAETLKRFGSIDFFHNNAGIDSDQGPLIDFTLDGYRRLFDINVLGVLLGLRSVAKAMIAGGGGSIVNTGSVTASRSAKGHALYGATKAAVHRLTQHAAVELGPLGIRVNAIAPGPVDTPLYRKGFEAEGRSQEEVVKLAREMAANRPLGRAAKPEEAADLVMFLLSKRSQMMTGAILPLDGGVTA